MAFCLYYFAVPFPTQPKSEEKAISEFNLKLFASRRHLCRQLALFSHSLSLGKYNNVIHTKYAICNKIP
jgi:hypothetical protein